jgi:hypothetical protein
MIARLVRGVAEHVAEGARKIENLEGEDAGPVRATDSAGKSSAGAATAKAGLVANDGRREGKKQDAPPAARRWTRFLPEHRELYGPTTSFFSGIRFPESTTGQAEP